MSTSEKKPPRSETVTVRLEPKVRYLAELAGRKQRRTLSSFIEWAIQESLREVKLYSGTGYNGDDDISIEDEAGVLWDVDESERFVRLAVKYPELLTHEEQERWKMLSDSGLMSIARRRSNTGAVSWDWTKLEDYVFPRLRELWPSFAMAYYGNLEERQLWISQIRSKVAEGKMYPPLIEGKNSAPPTFNDMDDDIPF